MYHVDLGDDQRAGTGPAIVVRWCEERAIFDLGNIRTCEAIAGTESPIKMCRSDMRHKRRGPRDSKVR